MSTRPQGDPQLCFLPTLHFDSVFLTPSLASVCPVHMLLPFLCVSSLFLANEISSTLGTLVFERDAVREINPCSWVGGSLIECRDLLGLSFSLPTLCPSDTTRWLSSPVILEPRSGNLYEVQRR